MNLSSKYNNHFENKIKKSILVKQDNLDQHVGKSLVLHLKCSFNNTIACITNLKGDVLMWSSPACHGLKGSKRSTVFAARIAITEAAVTLAGPGVGGGRTASAGETSNKTTRENSLFAFLPFTRLAVCVHGTCTNG